VGDICHTSGAVYTCCPMPALPKGDDAASLYCWALSQHLGNEADLMRDHFKKKHGIFACQDWSVLSDDLIDGVPSINIGAFGSRPAWWGSWYNAATFARAWASIIRLGVWSKHGWTVKTDPDTVWFPDRLSSHLKGLPADEACYVRNAGGIMLGSIEVLSAGAVSKLAARMRDDCQVGVDIVGEDGWIAKCLDRLGVEKREEPALLVYSSEVGSCGSRHAIAYHAFKDVASYAACYDAATR